MKPFVAEFDLAQVVSGLVGAVTSVLAVVGGALMWYYKKYRPARAAARAEDAKAEDNFWKTRLTEYATFVKEQMADMVTKLDHAEEEHAEAVRLLAQTTGERDAAKAEVAAYQVQVRALTERNLALEQQLARGPKS